MNALVVSVFGKGFGQLRLEEKYNPMPGVYEYSRKLALRKERMKLLVIRGKTRNQRANKRVITLLALFYVYNCKFKVMLQ